MDVKLQKLSVGLGLVIKICGVGDRLNPALWRQKKIYKDVQKDVNLYNLPAISLYLSIHILNVTLIPDFYGLCKELLQHLAMLLCYW